MGRRKAPYLEAPSRPIFQTLPSELLHVIFSELDIKDIPVIRTTCSVFASVGLDYLEDEVPLVFHREKFRALTEIAKHPKLSERMRSLFYVVDRCQIMSYKDWDKRRPDPEPNSKWEYDREAKFYTERDFWASFRDGEKHYLKSRERKAAVSESDRRAAYDKFIALCEDIIDVENEGYDLQCLRVLFENCPKMREVTIALQSGIMRRLNASVTGFEDAMTRPCQDRHWWSSGIHQTLSVAKAAHHAGKKLDSLTISDVPPAIFDKHRDVGEEEWRALKALFKPLRRLRLWMNIDPPDGEECDFDGLDPGIPRVQRQCEQIFEDGHLHELLSSATELRVLKLGLPQWNTLEFDDDPEYSRLDLALGETVYPHLYELSISDCEVDEDYLVDLILRHKATLRRLHLSDISLFDFDASWVNVFTRISCQLPQLRRLRLRGDFYSPGDSDLSFESAGSESRRIAPYRDAMENFILKGGEYPTDDENILPDQADYPDECYRPPGLRQDNTEPDDPMRDYAWDEFDVRI